MCREKDSSPDSRRENEILLRRGGALVKSYILLVLRAQVISSLGRRMQIGLITHTLSRA